ncbi:MAG: hypothetical protein OXJ52_05775 [Oligoflexia bacterium]|nr:hypothetical protein [Oligoflexia bacterium]
MKKIMLILFFVTSSVWAESAGFCYECVNPTSELSTVKKEIQKLATSKKALDKYIVELEKKVHALKQEFDRCHTRISSIDEKYNRRKKL